MGTTGGQGTAMLLSKETFSALEVSALLELCQVRHKCGLG